MTTPKDSKDFAKEFLDRIKAGVHKNIKQALNKANIAFRDGITLIIELDDKLSLSVSQMFLIEPANSDWPCDSSETALKRNGNIEEVFYDKTLGYFDVQRFETPQALVDEVFRLRNLLSGKKNWAEEVDRAEEEEAKKEKEIDWWTNELRPSTIKPHIDRTRLADSPPPVHRRNVCVVIKEEDEEAEEEDFQKNVQNSKYSQSKDGKKKDGKKKEKKHQFTVAGDFNRFSILKDEAEYLDQFKCPSPDYPCIEHLDLDSGDFEVPIPQPQPKEKSSADGYRRRGDGKGGNGAMMC